MGKFLKKSEAADLYIIILFLIIMYMPIFLIDNDKFNQDEKRILSRFPSFKSFGKFNTDFITELNDWFGDHYGFRNILINCNMLLNIRIFKASPTHKVMLGKEGWLFYSDKRDGDSISCYQNTNLFTKDQLYMIKANMIRLKNRCAELGADFILVIAPNKETIYSEFYPEGIYKIANYSRLDQITDFLKADSDILITDLKNDLLRAKDQEQLYYKTDTHWNKFGAFIAYQAIMKQMNRLYPENKADSFEDFIIEKNIREGGDLAWMLLLIKYYADSDFTFRRKKDNLYKYIMSDNRQIITEINNDYLPRAVMFRDSFSTALIPFFSNNFSRIVYIGSDFDDFDIIKKENPDIVIYEIVERHLNSLLF